jgi:hypothetical protein
VAPNYSFDGRVYVAPFSRTDFIQIHGGGATQIARDFDEFVKDLSQVSRGLRVTSSDSGVETNPALSWLTTFDPRRQEKAGCQPF